MKVIATTLMGGPKSNPLRALLQPLVNSEHIEEIHVVRDFFGHEHEKIIYQVVPPLFRYGILKTIYKLFIMIKILNNNKIDLIIGYNVLPHGLNALLCGKIFNVKSCISILGEPDYWNSDKRPRQYVDRPDNLSNTTLYSQEKIRSSKIEKRLIIKTLQNCDIVTVCGKKSREALHELGIEPAKIKIMPNSIDTAHFKDKNKDTYFDILYVGRIVLFPKNVDLVVRVTEVIKRKFPEIRVAVVGDGPALKELINLSKRLRLDKNIFFFGYQQDILRFYQNSKIFLTCSESEGLPFSMLEAMSVGLPVVISNVGDVSDSVIDGYNSYLINEVKNVENYAVAIEKLLFDKKRYITFSQNAAKFVREKYSYSEARIFWEKILLSQ